MTKTTDIADMNEPELITAIAQQKGRGEAAYAASKKLTWGLTLLGLSVTRAAHIAGVGLHCAGAGNPFPVERAAALRATLRAGTEAVDQLVQLVATMEAMSPAALQQAEERAKADFHTAEAQKGVAALNAAGARLMASRGIQPAGKAA